MKKLFSRTNINFLLFSLFLAGFIFLGRYFSIDEEAVRILLQDIPLGFSALAFIISYVIGTFLIWQLKDPLKIVGAVLFGAYLSTVLIYIAEIINACIFFELSRKLGRRFVEKKLKGRLRQFYERIETMNMGWVFLLRAVPLIPYRVLDLSFGLSGFSFRKYLLVVLLASLPRIFAIQFVLAAIGGFSLEKTVAYFQENQAVALALTLYFLIAVVVVFKLKLKK